MERFDIRGSDWGLQRRQDGLGAFCWAEVALNYKQGYYMGLIFNIIISIVCAILAAYLVFHQHDPQPVQVSEEEYRAAQQQAQQAQAERAALLRRIEDLGAIRRNLSAQLRTQNANNAKLVQQLKDLQASVPPLPVIQEALRKETATPQGFRQAVDRAFGNGMGARIKVVNE